MEKTAGLTLTGSESLGSFYRREWENRKDNAISRHIWSSSSSSTKSLASHGPRSSLILSYLVLSRDCGIHMEDDLPAHTGASSSRIVFPKFCTISSSLLAYCGRWIRKKLEENVLNFLWTKTPTVLENLQFNQKDARFHLEVDQIDFKCVKIQRVSNMIWKFDMKMVWAAPLKQSASYLFWKTTDATIIHEFLGDEVWQLLVVKKRRKIFEKLHLLLPSLKQT